MLVFCAAANFYIHDAKNVLLFTQDLMQSQMNLVAASQNNKNWVKILKEKQTVAEERISTLCVFWGFKYKSRIWRETQNRALSSHLGLLLIPKPNWSQLESFSMASLLSLTLTSIALLNFREKTGNFAALVCCPAKAPKIGFC